MGWAARTKQQRLNPNIVAIPSTVASRKYGVKHMPEMYAEGKGFKDARGKEYVVAPDGSLRRQTMEAKDALGQ